MEYAYIPGKYVNKYTDEIDGETIDINDTIILKDDHTCEISFQDDCFGEWTGTKLLMNGGICLVYGLLSQELSNM